jgi:predicted ATPase
MLPTDFTLTNIGKIEHATIKLNKFTVLCGKNSVGKSFFSKSLFLLYKSVYEYEDWVYIEIERIFRNITDTISRILFSPSNFVIITHTPFQVAGPKKPLFCQ